MSALWPQWIHCPLPFASSLNLIEPIRVIRCVLFCYQASGTDHPALFSRFLSTDRPHWINAPLRGLRAGGETIACQFRFQHTHPLLNCLVSMDVNGCLDLELEKPLRALSPGQYAVLYTGDVCLGSAQIRTVGPTMFELLSNGLSCRHTSAEVTS